MSQAAGAVCGETKSRRQKEKGGDGGELAVMWLVQGPTKKGPAEHKNTPGLESGHRAHSAAQRGTTGLRRCSRQVTCTCLFCPPAPAQVTSQSQKDKCWVTPSPEDSDPQRRKTGGRARGSGESLG